MSRGTRLNFSCCCCAFLCLYMATITLNILKNVLSKHYYRNTLMGFGQSSIAKYSKFFPTGEGGPKEGYTKVDEVFDKMPRTEIIRNGLRILKEELKVWKDEVKEKFESDPILTYRPGEIDVVFRFDTDIDRNKWILSSDSDHNEGFSECSLVPTEYGTATFKGNISSRVPLDGRIKYSGYCNATTERKTRSFKRDSRYDWSPYTHLVLKVRGDGRSYMLNLHCPGDYDILWSDVYHYVLYTRGGPYWQLTKIPFSKFFLGAKGRLQDIQAALPLNRVTSLGITAADGIEGPFNLEIDYIGLEFDPNHTEEFAYEMYHVGSFIVKS